MLFLKAVSCIGTPETITFFAFLLATKTLDPLSATLVAGLAADHFGCDVDLAASKSVGLKCNKQLALLSKVVHSVRLLY